MVDPNKIPQELHNTDPVLWWLMMCLSETTLDVLLTCPIGNCRIATRQYELDPTDYLKSLQDVVYRNEWLMSDFGRSAAIVHTRQMMMAPPAFSEHTMLSMLGVLWPDRDMGVCADGIGGGMGTMVSGVDSALLAYVKRTFPTMGIHNRLIPLVTFCCAQSRDNEQVRLYVNVKDMSADIIYISDDKIRAVNTYDITGIDDVVYYVMMVAKAYRFDNENDAVMIFGGETLRQELSDKLSAYISDIRQPSIYKLASTYQFREVPVELTLMPLCV